MTGLGGFDALAAAQFGLLARRQLLAAISADQLDIQVRLGTLQPVHVGVYRCAGAPVSFRQRAMAACLAYGAPVAISHRAAGLLWKLEGVHAREIEVTVPHARSGRRRAVVTYRRPLPPEDVTERYGIAVTTPARTLADLAGAIPPGALAAATDDALRRRLVTVDELAGAARLPRLPRQLRALVDQRREHPATGDSAREDEVFWWLIRAGLGTPARQHQVALAAGVYVLDLAYPDARVAVEYDSWIWHGGAQRRRFTHDRTRTTELQLAGWLVVQVTSDHGRDRVVDDVRRALLQRRAPVV